MNHNVFYFRKMVFHTGMNIFRNGMGFPQRFIAVNSDFQVDINLISEHSGANHIHADDILLGGNVQD